MVAEADLRLSGAARQAHIPREDLSDDKARQVGRTCRPHAPRDEIPAPYPSNQTDQGHQHTQQSEHPRTAARGRRQPFRRLGNGFDHRQGRERSYIGPGRAQNQLLHHEKVAAWQKTGRSGSRSVSRIVAVQEPCADDNHRQRK